MKKIVFALVILINALVGNAQNYENLYVDGMIYDYCDNNNLDGFIIHGETECNNHWSIVNEVYVGDSATYYFEYENCDSIIIQNNHRKEAFFIQYEGCSIISESLIIIINVAPGNPFTEPIIWKRQGLASTLNCDNNGYYDYDCLWSTGETTPSIEVSEPGTYSVTLTNDCGSATYSVEVRDNVELYRATVDLRTNKNKVTWLATPEQAEYITEVKVYRDGNLVGTAPYANGYFLDAIGSDAAARTYQIVGVSVEGEDCPIASYQKGTIHTTYYLDVNNDLNMTWNAPYIQEEAEGQLIGYQIYKYDPATEELTLIDEVNTTITNYTCSANAFVGGRAILAATFDRVSPPSGGDGQRPEGADGLETRSFSNLSENMFAVGEETMTNFKVYPNPANGAFTVEGAKEVTVYNTLGQAVATSHSEEGRHSFSLPSGVYFVKADERVKKVVVE